MGSGKDRLTGRLNLDAKAMNGKLNMKFNTRRQTVVFAEITSIVTHFTQRKKNI
jgi:hypothetical protein